MRKTTLLLLLMAVCSIAFAQRADVRRIHQLPKSITPLIQPLSADAAQPTVVARRTARHAPQSARRAPRYAEPLVVPSTATTVSYVIQGDYYNYSSQSGYAKVDEFSPAEAAVAIDGTDIYIQGLAHWFPQAWVKGTISGSTVTVPTYQYLDADDYGAEYLCGSSLDGTEEKDITFAYDAETGTLTLDSNIDISANMSDNTDDNLIYYIGENIPFDSPYDEYGNMRSFKNSKIWGLLYDFQKDAALAIINKLEKYNGCILADSVGLGKTFTALSVIKYYENRNKSVLVLCPKKLCENWNTYKGNYINNPIADDRLRYDVLFHTDLSRDGGNSNGIDLSRINWGNYDLCVIDESHNFRNGIGTHSNTKENRYQRLMERVVRAGVRTKVLMLSATPVNNRFTDLRNQLALAYEGEPEQFEDKLKIKRSIEEIFRNAQRAFNDWSKKPVEKRTTQALLGMLDFDFFELLDSVTIARSRKHIEKYYNTASIGKFPERLKPISVAPCLTKVHTDVNYTQIYEMLSNLYLTIYTPSNYILPSRMDKYTDSENIGLTQRGREEGIRRLMSINLLKRLESSVYSFTVTVERIKRFIEQTIQLIHDYKSGTKVLELVEITQSDDFDGDDQNTDFFGVGKKVKIDLEDMDYVTWLQELEHDVKTMGDLEQKMAVITPERDEKLQTLCKLIAQKIEHPINANNKKILIFTAFADTADYLYQHVSRFVKEKFNLDTAEITGSVDGRTTVPKLKCDLNTVLTVFSPISKGKNILMPNSKANIDVLIATDCISEGQNLQDCDYLINYDIHWNPVRIIQRFGRIDRIGSKNQCIQLVNFWPDMDLDEYINLKSRVETRMKITVMTSTGDDDLINAEEKGDLEYRREQLKRLQREVVDLEDMGSGISIMDLGLNEFRLDLLEYLKQHEEIENAPKGIHAVVAAGQDTPPGVIFVLKIICDYLDPKKLLDTFRFLCRGKSEPSVTLCKAFNTETKDGKDMKAVSALLSDAISSVMDVKEESDIDSLFTAGGTTALISDVNGLDDFELICFLVVR